MKHRAVFLILFPLFVLVNPLFVLMADQELVLTEVLFEEIEPGIEPYQSRLLLGKKYLRLDDANDRGDFVLFDRQTHEIHSFNHEEQSHLVMKPLARQIVDFTIDFKVERQSLHDAPKVNGVSAVQYQYFADKQLCKMSVNVAGLLPEINRVLIDYEQAKVEQNKQTLSQIPDNVRSSCYMANNYLHASDYLKSGFPMFVSDDRGRQKKLLSFRQLNKPASIMKKPEGYSLYYPNSANLKAGSE